MADTALATTNTNGHDAALEAVERVLVDGDVSKMSAEQRIIYYKRLCESLGLNPLTRPLQYITLQGKLVLYATKAATDQIARNMGISIQIVSRETDNENGIYTVIARATDHTGRSYDSEGIVSIARLKDNDLCNALMKAATKARRRAVLGMGGLGMMDETELETVRAAAPAHVDLQTGEIVEPPPPALPPATAQTGVKEQMQVLLAVAQARGLSKDEIEQESQRAYNASVRNLTYQQRTSLIETIRAIEPRPATPAADEPF